MYEKYIKRFLDFFISLIAIIILSPIFLIVAILVRLKLGKPIIFKQKRPGKNEKIFTLYKFRTMTDEKDKDGNLLPDSKRLTKFGKILRSTSLDELPELINILKGEMSLIGPRPLAVSYLPYYNEKEKHRHDVRPGLTGLAQINGRNNLNWEERFACDLQYVNNISFINDLKIFLKTFLKVFKKEDISVRGTGKTIDFDKYRGKQNMIKLEKKEELDRISKFFTDTRFNMGKSVLQGLMGEAYVADKEKPNFAYLLIRAYCFINGDETSQKAEMAIKNLPNTCKCIVPGDNWKELVEKVYANNFKKGKRYSIKKEGDIFDREKLKKYVNSLDKNYTIKEIDGELYNKIQATDSYVTNLNMTDDYKNKGIGVCALKDDVIVGVATSNIIYNDGIEINIKVSDEHRRKGIGTAISAKLILNCLEKGLYPSWDAANLNSVGLAEKLGYHLEKEYDVYFINQN